MDVIPLPSTPPEGAPAATCAGCGAPLVADQRYCLACGRPCSPVRLAFLDVLGAEYGPGGVGGELRGSALPGAAPVGYPPLPEPDGMLGALRRYSGLFGLLGVLLASLLIGLLVGHWLTGSASPGKQVYEIKGLPALAAAPSVGSTGSGSSGSGTSTGSGSSGGHGSSAGSSASPSHSSTASESHAEEAEAAKEVQTTKALPAAHKTSSSALEKIAHTTGKQHAKEVAAQGSAPIETGGH